MVKKIIVFEGIDGAGKTYQAKKLEVALLNQGYSITLAHSPSRTPRGDYIKKNMLKWNAQDRIIKFTEDLEEIVLETDTDFLVFDRYTYSSIANYTGELKVEDVIRLTSGARIPDICFFIDVKYDIVVSRPGYNSEEAHHDRKTQNKKYNNYVNHVAPLPEVMKIDGTQDKNTISRTIQNILRAKKILDQMEDKK